MCKCIVDWVPDDEVIGSHNRVPYTCEQYTADLEKIIESLMKTQADGLTVLRELAKLRDRQSARLAWAGLDSTDSGPHNPS